MAGNQIFHQFDISHCFNRQVIHGLFKFGYDQFSGLPVFNCVIMMIT
jgi:hypothetical protein